jgi:siderophore synthetase component
VCTFAPVNNNKIEVKIWHTITNTITTRNIATATVAVAATMDIVMKRKRK